MRTPRTDRVITTRMLNPPPFPTRTRRRALTAATLLALVALAGRRADGQTLRGSKASVERAHSWAVAHALTFEPSRKSVVRAAMKGAYVPLRGSDYRLKGVAMPYVLPTTAAWVDDMASKYRDACGEPLTVTSALRPTTIRLRNSVAESVHPTGLAVDLRKPRGQCRTWLRSALLGMERRGVIDATEERFPAHFHVVVYGAPARATAPRAASLRTDAPRAESRRATR